MNRRELVNAIAAHTGQNSKDVDATLAKLWSFSRGVKGEFRVDVLNVLNTPHFDRPSGNLDSTNFGQITAVIDSNADGKTSTG